MVFRHSRHSGAKPPRIVIPATAPPLPSFPRKRESICFRSLALARSARFARTDSRPCAFRPPSWRPSYFLLLVQEKVTKDNTPSAPRRSRSERCATGERVFSTGHPWPVEKIGAIPRAARVRSTRLIRSPFAAALEGFESESKGKGAGSPLSRGRRNVGSRRLASALASAAGTAALLLFQVPLGRGEQAKDQPRAPHAGACTEARAFAQGTRMCPKRTPCLLA
jgi:hypothetical protein